MERAVEIPIPNAQNLNRYTYVLNNPLSYTDPSGLSFVKKYWRQIASIAINMFLPGAGLFGSSLFVNTVASGFISGVVSSGSLQGGLMGAFSAGVFYGIGKEFASMAKGPEGSGFWGTRLTGGQFAAKVLTHGIAGGMMSTLQGGKFGHGFASAGVAQLAAPGIDGLDEGNAGFSATRVAAAAIVGGTASVLSGGKFANGAVTAAFARAFNDEGRHPEEDLPQVGGFFDGDYVSEEQMAAYRARSPEHFSNGAAMCISRATLDFFGQATPGLAAC